MFFQHIYEKGLAQTSGIIGCQETGTALVIDPKRDIDTYLEIAGYEKLRITHVTETHIHADFLSGARELAAATGAELLLSDEGGADWQYQYDHTGLKDEQKFRIGNVEIQVLHTPGHTPEHISFLVTDLPAGRHPIMLFSGDFVFVGDVGRPDLLEKAAGLAGTQEPGARQMFESLKKFRTLPDFVQVWPGHGAGSACGKALGAVPSSTVGYEKLVNWALREKNEKRFIERLLEGQPEPPKYFAMMKKLNKAGAPVLKHMPRPKRLSLHEFDDALGENALIVDTRHTERFAEGHIRGSLSIPDNSSLSTWAGWLLDYKTPFVIIAEENRMEELMKKFIRIGLDHIRGYFPNLDEWTLVGRTLEKSEVISVDALKALLLRDPVFIVDVRSKAEFDDGHLRNSTNIHLGLLADRLKEIPKDKKIVVQCESGSRSAMGTGLLLSKGFRNVCDLTGGLSAWRKAGYEVVTD
jgi:hydroxyacylglutathione hydrolase